MNLVGIMQGRLSPALDGRIQGFPAATWREEFARAREVGLDCIEWIYEVGTDAGNPLGSDAGVAEIHSLAEATGVAVRSVCADYYMAERLVGHDGRPRDAAVRHLAWLIGRIGALGARHVVLPFVDASSLGSPAQVDGLLTVLKDTVGAAETAGIELHLETDLPPAALAGVLDRVGHPLVRANYDIGNAASLGHDPTGELPLLGASLGSVHVKDRVRGGGTVPLGQGAADFPTCFRLILASGYRGSFILQAAREAGPSEVDLASRNRRFVERHLSGLTGAAG